MNKKPKIIFFSPPLQLYSQSDEITFRKFLRIIQALSGHVLIISGNLPKDIVDNNQIIGSNVKYDIRGRHFLIKALMYCWTQLKMASSLFKAKSQNAAAVFFFKSDSWIVPLLAAKICRMKSVLFNWGPVDYARLQKFGRFKRTAFFISRIVNAMNFYLVDKFVTESPAILSDKQSRRYREKMFIINFFVDKERFFHKEIHNQRLNKFVCLGRFIHEKNLFNLIEAFPGVAGPFPQYELLIAGSGPLEKELKAKIAATQPSGKIELRGWVDYNQLPELLNQVKFLILPSITEGLPNVVIEAMACGVVVLATSVGGVPDVIKDAETGFLLKGSSPEDIKNGILRVLSFAPDKLEAISQKASAFIRENYSYEAALDRAKKVLESL